MRLIILSIKGGGVFELTFDRSLPDALKSAWAIFGDKQVEVRKTYECSFILYGRSIPGKYFYLSKPRVLLFRLRIKIRRWFIKLGIKLCSMKLSVCFIHHLCLSSHHLVCFFQKGLLFEKSSLSSFSSSSPSKTLSRALLYTFTHERPIFSSASITVDLHQAVLGLSLVLLFSVGVHLKATFGI